ncbi:MAG: UDP-N-acetylmuramoyl-L-alanine--D-glutamate ligase [Clostridia bacterium]|nr:UDP-N-acetylmuramoyl-L-alanine--D-glutamate ligase [Clostridia bacterium]
MNTKAQSFLKSLKGKKIALCGIGRSHLPLVSLFTKYGAAVTACDKRTEEQLGDMAVEATNAGAVLRLGENYLDNLDADIVFRTPGMRYYMEELTLLREKGVTVTSEMEVFFDLCPCKIIAVTGSDGKTTTTTVISEMLKAEGKNVHLGGNIGKPLLPEIETISEDDYAVVELSSFQLISMRQSPDVAVVTNLAPNHLDVHKDMQEYIDAKKNIVLHQNAFSKAVLNLDNDISNSFSKDVRGVLYKFSRRQQVSNGAYMKENGDIVFCENGNETFIMNRSDIKIPGLHNVENYLAAISAVWGDVSVDSIVKTAKNFGGVAHRNEFVRELNGVKYYNDSIASSPTRTALGTLSLYDEKIIVILGGYDKHLDYTDLGKLIVKKVKTAIIMGATGPKIEQAILSADEYSKENPRIIKVNNMEEAVQAAFESAQSGDIVSMSPASASFDLYKNFEERGEHFKSLVNKL